MQRMLLALGSSLLISTALNAAAPPIQTATNDDRGRFIVNGQPFFPILMYGVPADAPTLTMIRDHGFNMISTKFADADTVLSNGLYCAVHPGKTPGNLAGVLLGIGVDSPALNYKTNLLERVETNLAKVRAAIPGRPIMNAIGYWEDEPTGVYSNKLPAPAHYEDLITILEVAAPYLYPVPYQPIRSVGEAVARARVATAGKKPLLPILQLFAWKADDRYPTPTELRCMVYLSLIHGATGIGYYSYNHVTGKKGTNIAVEQPALWKAVKEINGEIKTMSPLLLEGAKGAVTLLAGGPDVEFRAVTHGTSTLILLANTANAPKTAVVKFTPKDFGNLKPVGSHQVPVASDKIGVVSISLEPNQAAAWIE